jgi:hypothetical protein
MLETTVKSSNMQTVSVKSYVIIQNNFVEVYLQQTLMVIALKSFMLLYAKAIVQSSNVPCCRYNIVTVPILLSQLLLHLGVDILIMIREM